MGETTLYMLIGTGLILVLLVGVISTYLYRRRKYKIMPIKITISKYECIDRLMTVGLVYTAFYGILYMDWKAFVFLIAISLSALPVQTEIGKLKGKLELEIEKEREEESASKMEMMP